MNKNILYIALAAAGIVVAVVLYQKLQEPARQSPPQTVEPAAAPRVAPTNQVAELHKKLSQQNREVARLKTENKALWEGLSNAVTVASEPAPKPAVEKNAGGGDGAGVSKMISTTLRQQADMKLLALKKRLNLSDEQTEAVREVLGKFAEVQAAMASKMFGGKMTPEDRNSVASFNLDGQLKQLLTAEQWTGYEQYKVEEQRQQMQMAAQAELMQLGPALQLSAQQQEQVGAILQQQYQQYMTQSSPMGVPPENAVDQMLNAKKEALSAVLTPEQQQAYEKFIESQREMIKNVTGMMGGGKGQPPAR